MAGYGSRDHPRTDPPSKQRPRNLLDGLTNRSAPQKKFANNNTSADVNGVVPRVSVDDGIFGGVSVLDQYRYLQMQHQELMEKYNALKREHRVLEDRHVRLQVENGNLKEAYEELQENYNSMLDSQKSFTAGKLMVYLKLKRRENKESLEKRNIIKNEACFNTFLEDVQMHETNQRIPKIVVECVTVVESSEKFMKSVGLYRVSGNHNTIQNLRYDINADSYKKLRRQKSPHEVCGILKLFLRELKEPLVSLWQLNRIIPGPSDMIHNRVLKVLELVNSLDDTRRETLQYLIKHLKKVVAVEDNEMDTLSVAMLMSSCIFNETLTDVCPERFETVSAVPRECIITMIDRYDEIFDK